MYRAQCYNESRFFRLTPVSRIDVVPGQSVDIMADVRMRSPNFLSPTLSGGMWTVASFYVPYRLLWNNWVQYVTERAGNTGATGAAAQVPTATNSWPFMLERRSAAYNVWGRRAYKLIYNQFFGDKDMGYYYSDITGDGDVSLYPVRGLDQFLSKLVMTGSIVENVATYNVSANQISIPLNDFRHQLEIAREFKRRDMSGNKYVDAMLSMGVKLDWRVQQAPELLSLQKGEFAASITVAQNKDPLDTNQTLGQFSTYYDVRGQHRTGRKFFAEHGTILTVAVMRPHVFNESAGGSYFQNAVAQDEYFWGNNMDGKTTAIPGNVVGSVAGSSAQLPRFQQFESGQNVMGTFGPTPWVVSRDIGDPPPNIDMLVYPVVTRAEVGTGLASGTDVVMLANVQADIKTPIGKGIRRL